MSQRAALLCRCVAALLGYLSAAQGWGGELIGEVRDATSGALVPARVYVRSSDGEWLFVESTDASGSALPYREQWVPMPQSVERHSTISAHPFRLQAAAGSYDITIERGKEYQPLHASVTIGEGASRQSFRLRRWVDMAARGWYSGETHVHRRISELPNVMLAEDLNVAFPVTFWTVRSDTSPNLEPSTLRRQGPSPFGPREDRGYRPIYVDPQHVILPRNTEYEIFSIGDKRHTLGAIFVLNHRTVFRELVPPVAGMARRAHSEGALLDLDKHSWPWAMMLVPIAKVDLFELSNNSVWRTEFGFRRTPVAPAEYMQIESNEQGMTEWGWLNYGWQNYYALLNCGFRLQPTAGTASGVHPVPLGHSRVYVHIGDAPFSDQAWISGLRSGRSFVTTGPMLFAKLDGQQAGHVFQRDRAASKMVLDIESLSERPVDRVEIVVNGQVTQTLRPTAHDDPGTPHRFRRRVELAVGDSSWVIVRSIQKQPDGRIRFAHTAPWHIEIDAQPVRPRRREVEYLIQRVRGEIDRNRGLLSDESLAEFREALRIYEGILGRATD